MHLTLCCQLHYFSIMVCKLYNKDATFIERFKRTSNKPWFHKMFSIFIFLNRMMLLPIFKISVRLSRTTYWQSSRKGLNMIKSPNAFYIDLGSLCRLLFIVYLIDIVCTLILIISCWILDLIVIYFDPHSF